MRDFNSYSTEYKNLDFENKQVLYRKKFELELIEKIQAKKILEIGCGLLPIYKFLEDFDRIEIIEPCKEFFEAIENDKERPGNIRVFSQTLEEVDKNKISAPDLVLVSSVLHEVEEPRFFLEKLRNLLPSGTKILINVPNAESLHRKLAKSMGLIGKTSELSITNQKMQQFRVYDEASLVKELSAAGFKTLNTETIFVKPFTHKQMEQMLKFKIIDESVLDGLYDLAKQLTGIGSEICNYCEVIDG
ncbi:MAG: class I SAM-dependent methyltransferase [Bdellovibrionales bacterium]